MSTSSGSALCSRCRRPPFSRLAGMTTISASTPGKSRGAPAAAPDPPGLYHTATLYPPRAGRGNAFRRLKPAAWPLDGYNDHGTHEALYLSDPEGNGLELAWDRPEEEWPRD